MGHLATRPEPNEGFYTPPPSVSTVAPRPQADSSCEIVGSTDKFIKRVLEY